MPRDIRQITPMSCQNPVNPGFWRSASYKQLVQTRRRRPGHIQQGGPNTQQHPHLMTAIRALNQVERNSINQVAAELAVDESIEAALGKTMIGTSHTFANPRASGSHSRHVGRPGQQGLGTTVPTMVDQAPERDEVAAKAKFDKYVLPEVDVMFRVAMSLTRNTADAEDLVQDSLLRAYRAIDRFDGRYPRAWLLTILRNAQINRVRRKRPELLRDPDATMARVADTSVDGKTAEELVVDQGFDPEVEAAFEGLPEKFRTVVQLVDIDGLSYQEAADRVGIPVGTIMSRLHRARKRIRHQLEAAGLGPKEAGR